MSEARFDRIDQELRDIHQRFEQVDRRFEQVDQRFDRVEGRLDRLERGQTDLRREMLVLHEHVIETIKAIPDPTPRFEQVMKREIGQLREEIGRRLDPLEVAVRRHFGA